MRNGITARQMLTWLNGRACKIEVLHNGKKHVLWSPKDGTSIEDMLLAFVRRYGIDVREEVLLREWG